MTNTGMTIYKSDATAMANALRAEGLTDVQARSMLNAVLRARDFAALKLSVLDFKLKAEGYLQSQETSSGNITQRNTKLDELCVKQGRMEALIDNSQD